jgi:hypothetical protein
MKYKPMSLLAALSPDIAGTASASDSGDRFDHRRDHRH